MKKLILNIFLAVTFFIPCHTNCEMPSWLNKGLSFTALGFATASIWYYRNYRSNYREYFKKIEERIPKHQQGWESLKKSQNDGEKVSSEQIEKASKALKFFGYSFVDGFIRDMNRYNDSITLISQCIHKLEKTPDAPNNAKQLELCIQERKKLCKTHKTYDKYLDKTVQQICDSHKGSKPLIVSKFHQKHRNKIASNFAKTSLLGLIGFTGLILPKLTELPLAAGSALVTSAITGYALYDHRYLA